MNGDYFMTFEQLEYFIAAVESDTFFDAAETLHTTQSTLSKQIKKLETELEVTLWDRSRRHAELTPAGQAFYTEAQKLSRQYHDTLQKMSAYQYIAPHKLHIGTLPFLAQYHLTEPIRRFIQLHPEICLTLSEVEETELLLGLSQDIYELVIARETMIDPKHYHFKPITHDTLSVILPENHPLANQPLLSLADIKSEEFVLMHPYTSIYLLCQKLFTNAAIQPNILRTARVESIISAVQIGEGISLFPESNFQLFHHDGLVAIPLADAPQLQIGFAYKKNRELLPILNDLLQYTSHCI